MRSFVVALVVALPIALATVILAWIPLAERVDPDTDDRRPLNIAEAAGQGNASEVVRRLRLGEDPNRMYPVRPHVIPLPVTMTTAVEAAVWARQVRLMDLLDREGVILGGHSREELACLAGDIGAQDVAAYLAKGQPPTCEPRAALQHIIARSSEGSQP
jgi:hypothetical protein